MHGNKKIVFWFCHFVDSIFHSQFSFAILLSHFLIVCFSLCLLRIFWSRLWRERHSSKSSTDYLCPAKWKPRLLSSRQRTLSDTLRLSLREACGRRISIYSTPAGRTWCWRTSVGAFLSQRCEVSEIIFFFKREMHSISNKCRRIVSIFLFYVGKNGERKQLFSLS